MSSSPSNPSDASRPTPQALAGWVAAVGASYAAHPQIGHVGSAGLPSRARVRELLDLLRRLMFPGFHDERPPAAADLDRHLAGLLAEADAILFEQVRQSLRYADARCRADGEARRICDAFWAALPEARRVLATDVQAAFEGDPAAVHTDETVFCYPGVEAVFTHRLAHQLHLLKVPMVPRIMAELAHAVTGVDIHPGATIGESFFIDHGTGVVIGETCVIGRRVKVYQGVTLGALSTRGGQAIRGKRRHPTIEDDVTIYPNSTILGGDTVVGARSVIGGGAFVTQSVPADLTFLPARLAPEVRSQLKSATDFGHGI